jgi:hypothetical protein
LSKFVSTSGVPAVSARWIDFDVVKSNTPGVSASETFSGGAHVAERDVLHPQFQQLKFVGWNS